MLSRRKMFIIVTAFAAAHCGILFAGFFAPYTPATQHREYAYAAPTKLHFVDVAGHVHIRPFVYPSVPVEGDGFQYREDPTSTYPIRLFSRNSDGTHLLSVDAPAHLFLFGTDGYGRDIFSRVLARGARARRLDGDGGGCGVWRCFFLRCHPAPGSRVRIKGGELCHLPPFLAEPADVFFVGVGRGDPHQVRVERVGCREASA